MAHVDDPARKGAVEMLEKLTLADRAYVLYRLVREKLEGESPGAKVPVESPDGAIFGYLQSPEPPPPDDVAVMRERARRINAGVGHPVRNLLERMSAGDEDGVRKFVQ